MFKLSQKGIAQIIVVLIILAGIGAGLVLVKNPAIFKPKASTPKASTPKVSIIDREKRFLENFVNTPEAYGVDIAREAGNRAIALAVLGRKDEAKQVILNNSHYISQALGAYNMGLAAFLSQDLLSETESAAVKEKVIAQADREPLRNNVSCDSGVEHNAWNAALLALVANFYRDDPRAAGWEQRARFFAFHSLTKAPGESYGKLTTANVDSNFILDNHDARGNVHYAYAASIGELGMGALTYILIGEPVPEEFMHNVVEVFDAHKLFFDKDTYQYLDWMDCRDHSRPFGLLNGRDDYGGDATWNNSAFAYIGFLSDNYSDLDKVTSFEYFQNGSKLSRGPAFCPPGGFCRNPGEWDYILYSVIAKRSAISLLIYQNDPRVAILHRNVLNEE